MNNNSTNVNNCLYFKVTLQGSPHVSGKGGAGDGLVGDCGLVFPGADPGFPVIGGVLKKFHRVMRGAKIFGVLCVKNQDFMQKIIFFPILGGDVLESNS